MEKWKTSRATIVSMLDKVRGFEFRGVKKKKKKNNHLSIRFYSRTRARRQKNWEKINSLWFVGGAGIWTQDFQHAKQTLYHWVTPPRCKVHLRNSFSVQSDYTFVSMNNSSRYRIIFTLVSLISGSLFLFFFLSSLHVLNAAWFERTNIRTCCSAHYTRVSVRYQAP